MNLVKLSKSGFTLLEVVIAIGILAISLVAIFDLQGGNIAVAQRTQYITVATFLARSKMVDIERELFKTGFSDFAESESGNFDTEGRPDFRWDAQVSKVEIPIPTSFPGSEDNPNASMMMGASSFITDMIKNSLRECVVTVTWNEGAEEQSLKLTTHFIDVNKATQLQAITGGGTTSTSGEGESGSGESGSSTGKTGANTGANPPNTPKKPEQRVEQPF